MCAVEQREKPANNEAVGMLYGVTCLSMRRVLTFGKLAVVLLGMMLGINRSLWYMLGRAKRVLLPLVYGSAVASVTAICKVTAAKGVRAFVIYFTDANVRAIAEEGNTSKLLHVHTAACC